MKKHLIIFTALSTIFQTVSSTSIDETLPKAAPIFGPYTNTTTTKTSWMNSYPDSTPLIHMNIPGTHDSATWNYTSTTQASLTNMTALNGVTVPPPQTYRCQDLSMIDMLNSGIRAFDLRVAMDPTNSSLVFYHARALLSETASLGDVLGGFYVWLDEHPSETVFLSIQLEGETRGYAVNETDVQVRLYDVLTSEDAREYFIQSKDTLGSLGEARGKITLFRRFDLDKLPESYTDDLPGLHFPPSHWTDNSPDIQITYNEEQNSTAYIEDYYQPLTATGSSAAENIESKYNATVRHLQKAASDEYAESLFWTWASSENTQNVLPDWPRIMALGNGTYTPEGGVNEKLVGFLKEQKGKRMGIVMFDFFEQPDELVDVFLGL